MSERDDYNASVTTTSQRVAALRSVDPWHQVWAAEDLAGVDDAGVTEALVAALRGIDLDGAELGFARALVFALGGRETPEAIEAIVHTLDATLGDDEVPAVADEETAVPSVHALLRLHAPRAARLALSALDRFTNHGSRMAIVTGLGASGCRGVEADLTARSSNEAFTGGTSVLRAALLEAAARLGHAPARDRLVDTLEDATESPCVQGYAAIALLHLGELRSAAFLIDFLRRNRGHAEGDSRDPYVQRVVVQQRVSRPSSTTRRAAPSSGSRSRPVPRHPPGRQRSPALRAERGPSGDSATHRHRAIVGIPRVACAADAGVSGFPIPEPERR